jgi:hypothetical protein
VIDPFAPPWTPVTPPSTRVTVSDPGAVLTAGASCAALDAHTVQCVGVGEIATARAELGDLDDELRITGEVLELVADGGAGDDRLYGTRLHDRLEGGGGRDELHGEAGDDILSDTDRERMDAGAGPDVFDGGDGADTVSYAARTAPVIVDLADRRPDGARGERDVLREIENVMGGRGRDRLAGDDQDNWLHGSGGRDTLLGRAGNDFLFDVTGDRFSCGSDVDIVNGVRLRDFVDPGCELLAMPFRRGTWRWSTSSGAWFNAYPETVGRRAVTYEMSCPDPDDDEAGVVSCSGTLVMRQARGRRHRLASGVIPRDAEHTTVRLRLTAEGRRLAGRQHGVLATVQVRGRNLPTVAWTIRLKVPR